jgi:hypothetical protein
LTQQQIGAGADIAVNAAGFQVVALGVVRQTDPEAAGLSNENALGLAGWIRYAHAGTGLEAGVRAAYYEPSNVQPDDQLTELTAMIGFKPKDVPLRMLVQYTLRGEEAAATVSNNSIDAMLQVSW